MVRRFDYLLIFTHSDDTLICVLSTAVKRRKTMDAIVAFNQLVILPFVYYTVNHGI